MDKSSFCLQISTRNINISQAAPDIYPFVFQGLDFYEKLLVEVENSNQIKLDSFLNAPSLLREKLGYTGLALIAGQKIYLCLGDLARYKEQANDACNYGLSRQ